MNERTIRVTGTGEVSLKPDVTIINLSISNLLPTYELALKSSADDVAIIKDTLGKAGIDKESLKTTFFNVDTQYRSIKGDVGEYKRVLEGYKYEHSLRFEFDVNNELLGKILYQLGKLDIDVEFNLRYGVKDSESAKNALLEKAIADAVKKAEIIAKAAHVELGEIIDIKYGWSSFEFSGRSYDIADEVRGNCLLDTCKDKSYDIDIEPDDIERSDNVTLVYSIK